MFSYNVMAALDRYEKTRGEREDKSVMSIKKREYWFSENNYL